MPDRDLTEPNNTLPARRIAMLWAQEEGSGRIRVQSRMRWPTVLLEDIGAVTDVVCDKGKVSVSFDQEESFARARDAWKSHGRFVLVTNALGGCDAPAERGIYRATGTAIVVDPVKRKLEVSAERIRFGEAARSSDVTVRSVRVPGLLPRKRRRRRRGGKRRKRRRKRAVDFVQTLDMSGLEIFRLGNTSLVADRLRLDASLTLSGKLRLGFFSVAECWFDISGRAALDLALGLQIDAQLQRTMDRSTPPLTLPLLAVPGIVAVGPAIQLAVGVDVTAMASLYAEATLRLDFVDTRWHVDLVDGSRSRSTGLMPNFDAAVRLGGKASLHLDPFVDVRFLLNVQLLSGLFDLNGGIKVVPKIANAFSLDSGQRLLDDMPHRPTKPVAATESPDKGPPLSLVLLDQSSAEEKAKARYRYDLVDKPLYPQSEKSKKRKGKKHKSGKVPKPFRLRPNAAAMGLVRRRVGKPVDEAEAADKSPEQQAAERKAKEGRRKSNEVAVACRDGISLKSEFRLDVIAVLATWEWNLYRESVPFFNGCYALPASRETLLIPP
ncbi:hypothetical protein XA68_15646 [Ophiocordyceps unilateralis]|uniref:DUF7029 domain-containing protein n=1 Tax=Ophiocordyceps unilateralis TaxID=268505 RepID=A0A2A9P665_OPHUN|nr:hypothetical protein XA68_15646 [Ophiocordyceps unilateralis]